MGVGAVQPFLRTYWAETFTGVQVAWILASVYFSFSFFLLVNFATVGRLGLPLAIFLGAVGYFLFASAVAWVTSYQLLVAAAVTWGFSASLLWSGSASYVLDLSASASYGRSSQRLYLATRSGVVIGVLTYSILVGVAATHGLRWLAVSATAAAVVLVAFLPHPPVESSGRGGPGLLETARTMLAGQGPLVSLFLFLGAWISGIFHYLFVAYVADEIGAPWVVLATFPFYVAGASANLWVGSLSDRVGLRWVYAICFGGGAVGLAALAGVGLIGGMDFGVPRWALGAAIAVGSALAGQELAAVETLGMSWVGDHTSHGGRVRAYGMTFSAMDLGIATSVLAAAYLSEAVTAVSTLLVFAGLSLSCVGLSMIVRPGARAAGVRLRRRSES
jgi:MFS family permease